jgi:hypothetical protein
MTKLIQALGLILTMVLTTSCGDDPDPVEECIEYCETCCDRDGVCRTGTQDWACYVGGPYCVDCTDSGFSYACVPRPGGRNECHLID